MNRPNGASSGWSEERVDLLMKLWAEGLSASQCASRIGGITRNAVIGKIHRLGLSDLAPRSGKSRASYPKKRKPRNQRPSFKPWLGPDQRKSARIFAAEPFVPAPEIIVPQKERRGIADLQENQCRWPIGDPQKADFHFCNGKQVMGLPYCEHHCRVAFKPPEMRKKKIPPRYWNDTSIGDMTRGVDALISGEAPINTGDKVEA